MSLDLGLVTVLDIDESATLLPPGTPDDLRATVFLASHDPETARVDDDGCVTGIAPGSTAISVRDTASGRVLHEVPLTVRAPAEPAPALAPTHPRMRFAAGDVDETRRHIASLRERPEQPFGDDLAAFLALADQYAEETALVHEWNISGEIRRFDLAAPVAQPAPLEQPFGFTDYPFWTMLSRQVEARLTTLTAAWTLTGDRRYADRAKAQLLALAGWSKWHEYDKATNNLSLPHFTMGAAIAYDELHDLLSGDEHERVRDAIVRLGLRPMSHWMDIEFDHNIAVLMNAGMAMGFLAIGDEAPHLDKYFHAPLAGLLWYLAQRETSATTEGHVYTSYSFGTILPVAAAIRRATGRDDLFQSAYIRDELLDFFIYFRGGAGGYANLSDSRHEAHPFGMALHLLNEFADHRALAILADRTEPHAGLVPYLRPGTPPFARPELTLPRSRRFDRFDWAALRSGWGDDATLLAFVSSPSAAGHNHFDQNHFILNVGGEWLITDPGYQNYTPGPENVFTNATLGHNGLTVNGEGQSIRGHGRIAVSELGERLDYVVGDATDAYEGRIARWRRHIVFAVDGYVLLVDEIVPTDPDDWIDLHFHTLGGVLHNGRALPIGAATSDAGAFRFTGEAHGVGIAFDAGGDLAVRHEHSPGAERFGTYLTVTPQTRHAMDVVTLLTIDPPDDAPHRWSVVRENGSVTITVGEDTHRLRLGDASRWTLAPTP